MNRMVHQLNQHQTNLCWFKLVFSAEWFHVRMINIEEGNTFLTAC